MPDNPFALLGLEPRFDLDPDQLQRAFITAAARCHPDRFLDPLDQADAAEKSAAINEAYRTLQDPEQRANTLLMLLGGPSREQDTTLPPDLLMNMMEIREQLEEAQAQGDQQQLEQLGAWARQEQQQHLDRVAAQLDQARLQTTEALLKSIRVELNALRYIQRMIEAAD